MLKKSRRSNGKSRIVTRITKIEFSPLTIEKYMLYKNYAW